MAAASDLAKNLWPSFMCPKSALLPTPSLSHSASPLLPSMSPLHELTPLQHLPPPSTSTSPPSNHTLLLAPSSLTVAPPYTSETQVHSHVTLTDCFSRVQRVLTD